MEEELNINGSLQFSEPTVSYTDDNIRHLDDMEHIRDISQAAANAVAQDGKPAVHHP